MKFLRFIRDIFKGRIFYSKKVSLHIEEIIPYVRMFFTIMGKKGYFTPKITLSILYIWEVEWKNLYAYNAFKDDWYIDFEGHVATNKVNSNDNVAWLSFDNKYTLIKRKAPFIHSKLLDKTQKVMMFYKHFSKEFKINFDTVLQFFEVLLSIINRNWSTHDILETVKEGGAYQNAAEFGEYISKDLFFHNSNS